MNRIFIPLLLLHLISLNGQIYTQEVSPQQGGTLVAVDMQVDFQGMVHLAYFEFVPIYPNSTITADVPWLSRFDPQLKLDTIAQPLDSFPASSQHLTTLQSGDLLLGFSGGGFNGYNWEGYSYAILDTGYQPINKAYDTNATQLSLMHSMPLGDSTILGMEYAYNNPDSLMLINAYSGHKRWSTARVPGLPLNYDNIIGDAYRFSDSLRVFLRVGGIGFPCPRWNNFQRMVTLHRADGALGLTRQMSDTLISVGQVRPSPDYGLIYLDKTRENLTLEKRDSSWQVRSSYRINISTLLRQSQLPGYRLFAEPQVLKNGQGVGFLVSSGGITNADTVYYIRIDFSGQLRQKERVDSLPSGIRECRSLSGPDGSYFAIIKGTGVSQYIVKAQPRHRISLPAPETMSENLQVSPLPATDQLWLQLPAATGRAPHSYRLYGLTGQMYQRGQLTFSGGKATINVSGLRPGMYFLQVQSAKGWLGRRILVGKR